MSEEKLRALSEALSNVYHMERENVRLRKRNNDLAMEVQSYVEKIDELRGALATQCGLTLAARSVLADLYEYAGSAWFDEAIATHEEDELMARARTALRQTA